MIKVDASQNTRLYGYSTLDLLTTNSMIESLKGCVSMANHHQHWIEGYGRIGNYVRTSSLANSMSFLAASPLGCLQTSLKLNERNVQYDT